MDQGGEKMAMLQGFAKNLIANVQAEAVQLTLMAEELTKQGVDMQMSAAEPGGVDDLLDFMRRLEEDLIKEMMEQEQAMVQQYLEHQDQEDCALVQAAQCEEVICPVCLRGPLSRNTNGFFCQCGMQLRLASDQLSLPQLHANIQHGFWGHAASGCAGRPAAAVQAGATADTLVMGCSVCHYMRIIA